MRGIGMGFCVIFVTPGPLCGDWQKLRDADQIVCGGGEDKEPFDQVPPTVPGLSQAADRLDGMQHLSSEIPGEQWKGLKAGYAINP